jgi:hypothetical protein
VASAASLRYQGFSKSAFATRGPWSKEDAISWACAFGDANRSNKNRKQRLAGRENPLSSALEGREGGDYKDMASSRARFLLSN